MDDSDRADLLDSCVIITYERFGAPKTDAEQRRFDVETDALFHVCLATATRSPRSSMPSRGRVAVLMRLAIKAAAMGRSP